MPTRHLLRALLVLSLAAAGDGVARAGEIAPGLAAQLAATDPAEPVKAMVFLRDRVDVAGLDLALRLEKATLASRHARVLHTLQDHARRTQTDLLAALATERAGGRVLGFTPHWLVNGVVVVATPAALADLARRDDVDVIEADLVPALVAPVAAEPVPAAKSARGIGIAPGVVHVGARRVWEELGVRGEGALIGSLDTGVDGSHPALADRWRGLVAPLGECWFDGVGADPSFPSDPSGHGTHTAGTMCGLAPGDTIGIAPRALWIAANAIAQGAGPAFDNDILACFEWFTDPDGDPATLADVPDVVQNSWGINESFFGYVDCDSRWWSIIDACEAAGVVVTWAAGNEGPGAETLRSPADRATTLYDCFAVGATLAVPPFTIAGFSSRGPAGPDCGPEENRTKPELAAPGSDIYSALPGGGYGIMSGTSMAGPHVAGVVALMRAAAPDLDVTAIKQVLLDTAVDLGEPGEDNDYGHGLVDAYQAVLAVMDGIGRLEGVVVADDDGRPVPGAHVALVGTPRSADTDPRGAFRLILQRGDYLVAVSAFGFAPYEVPVTVVENETVHITCRLVRLPSATLSGRVVAPDGWPVTGAEVAAIDTPLEPVWTGSASTYSLLLPVGRTYTVRAISPRVGVAVGRVDLAGDTELDLVMAPLSHESFETGSFSAYPWSLLGHAPWTIDASAARHGVYCARSGSINHGQTSTLQLDLDVAIPTVLQFWCRTSSEAGFDHLEFRLDGVRVARWSGEVGWTEFARAVEPGHHRFAWTYRKDASLAYGADAAWIDLVTLPLAGEPPRIAGAPAVGTITVPPGAVASRTLTIGNAGEAPLDYRVTAQGVVAPPPLASPPPQQRQPVHEAKGETVVTEGRSPRRDQGGPDGFGYRWLYSHDPDGPLYQWLEIADLGEDLPGADDETFGPIPLGFAFPFYGETFTHVRVCTNGFLTFENTTAHPFSNVGIPSASDPDALIAVFWDDLDSALAGTIYWYADPGQQRFVVQWDEVAHWGSADRVETCEVILTPDGDIVCQYQYVRDDGDCTIGIENLDGTDGLEVVYNADDYLHSGLALRFTPRPAVPWLVYEPAAGRVAGGDEATVTLTCDTAGLAVGRYDAEVLIFSNDPTAGLVTVPVALTVGDAVAVGETAGESVLRGAAPNPFNPTTVLRFDLAAAGPVELKLFDVKGRLVRTLTDGYREAGVHEVRWDARNDDGQHVASGTYYARLVAAGESRVRPLVLVK